MKVVARHGVAVALVLVTAAVIGGALVTRMSTTYQASANVILLNSSVQDTVSGARYNPYALFGDNQLIAGQLVARVVNGDGGASRILKAGGTGPYAITLEKILPGTPAPPVLDVTAGGDSAAEALATLDAVVKTMSTELQD